METTSMTRRFYIADSSLAMQYYDHLQKQLRNEWPEFPPINTADHAVPKPLVALTSSGVLAGGLAFTAAKSPLSNELAIWVNGVLVAPEYRRQGVGSRLIEAAQEAARRAGVLRLYALTELPDLYSKLNWSILSNDAVDFVMTWDSDGAGQ
jgi:GNAT superfamily N-acetyltransferase